MENNEPLNTDENQKLTERNKQTTGETSVLTQVNSTAYQPTKKDWNSKILKITMMIREEFPELSDFLNEMPVTLPDESRPDVELEILKNYFDSLSSILNKYRLEHPHGAPQR